MSATVATWDGLADFASADSSAKLADGDFEHALEGDFIPQERELVTADGGSIPVLMQAGPVVDESGNTIGMRAMHIDMRDRRRAQRPELENQMVRQQQLALLGTLMAGIAHEVKNPLDFVINFAEASQEMIDDLVEIHIRDTGTGIPREDYERIFEPFFTTKAAGKGTGLGLAISRDIVLKHEGQISVHSDPGKFTEFVDALPIAPAPVGASV